MSEPRPYKAPETTPVIKLGDVVRDRITGFQGVVIGRTQWLNQCDRLIIQPQELKDGKPIDATSFDIDQCEVVATVEVEAPVKKTGGPRPEPRRASDPGRR